tara:strand:- start:57 stop:425 length:369 start_codon:yes stop_codon:yes gene_type:complete
MTDEARKQYSTYDSYLKRKGSNQYYNLGSTNYSKMTSSPSTLNINITNIEETYKYLIKALWFDRRDVDARKIITQMCQKWSDSDGTDTISGFTSSERTTWKTEAENEIKYGAGFSCGICPPK